MKNIYLIFLLIYVSCNSNKEDYRARLDLEGAWQFSLDSLNIGMEQQWYNSNLNDVVKLPGTTDTNQKGIHNKDTTTMHLNRVYTYEGVAWYRKKVVVPKNFNNKHIQLFLERTKASKIWIDSSFVGESKLLQSAQTFNVSNYLSPGEHYITIQINNDLKQTPYGNVHIYSDDTQTNWNGIIGDIYLEASPKTYISNLQVYPNVDEDKFDVEFEIENPLNYSTFNIELVVEKTYKGKTTKLKSHKSTIDYKPKTKLVYVFDEKPDLWDEYEQPLYLLKAIISNEKTKDAKTVGFGMRKFETKGTQFAINGCTTFLRGKHEAAVFPLTGYTPMNVDDWLRVFKIAKSYGINHYRFHTYCPPEAAFTAADQEGIYIQAELPFWGGLESHTIAQELKKEGLAMLKAYANHPSFVMFSPGNEIWDGHDKVEKMMLAFKKFDSRPLYTMGSNNNIGYMPPTDYADFFVGARIPTNGNTIQGHTRLTHAFADANDGGILNTLQPSTEINFDDAVSQLSIPIVGHEIGQYQIYPNYKEIHKYTGVLRAWNLEVFKNRLKKSGMQEMDSLFQKASGAWSALCYKAEIEAALRTKGLAGFQLLDLQDFPGQGTALVGILDAFMDSKNVVTPKDWKQSCNELAILPEFPKYCYINKENFQAKIKVANYSNTTISNPLHWELRKQDGTMIQQGHFLNLKIINGLNDVGSINIRLSSISEAEKLTLHTYIVNTKYSNSHPIWVYPAKTTIQIPNDILVTEDLNNNIRTKLNHGAKVLLFPQTEDVKSTSLPGHFPPEFWNYGMFKTISEHVNRPVSPGTLGLLMNPDHKLFNSFPTDFHTNWQWFSIIKASNSLRLDITSKDYKPIVQVIDNLERNHKLGLVFEFKVGKGKLMVCMSQLNKILDKPEALQLYQSIINYMNSEDFKPNFTLTSEELEELL